MSTKAKYESGFLRYYDNASLGEGGERIQVLAPIYKYDDFLGVEVDATNDWVESIVNSSTTTVVSGSHGGVARITTGGADDDDHELSSPLILKATKGIGMEARIALGDVAASAFNVGFTDAVTEAADLLAFTFATTTLTTTATDAALFFSDPDATSNVLRAAAVKNNTDSTITAGSLLVNDVFHVYRIEIDSSGNISWYFDGALFKTATAAITTSVALCAYVGLINRETAANTLDIDYIRYWSLSR